MRTPRTRIVVTALAGNLVLAANVFAQPANDNCANARLVTEGAYFGTTVGATPDGSASCGAAEGSPDVWFSYMAGTNGNGTFATCGSGFDTVISVWTGCPGSGGNEVGCNDNGCGLQSSVDLTLTAGQVYLIRVAGVGGATGSVVLNISATPGGGGGGGGGGSNGPDVTYSDISSVARYGPIGGIVAYSLGSNTCNIGDSDLLWTGNGTPGLAMNLYRLYDGRLMQVGMSWVKTACCAGASSGCGTCNGHGGSVLGAGCLDVYGAGWNAIQTRLARRSGINGFTGAFNWTSTNSPNDIHKRLQVAVDDMSATSFPGALYFAEGEYASSDDASAGNALNNVSYRRVTVSGVDIQLAGSVFSTHPAIEAWHTHGLGVNQVDPSVTIIHVDVPNEGRFIAATKVRDLGDGTWRYDYAVFNQNSDRSGGSFSVPLPAGANVTNVGFHDVNYHSGEPYDNTDWVSNVSASAVTWSSPQTFAQNPNSNALRWGTMYNFWFDADRGPADGSVTLGLFKPHTPSAVEFTASVPAPSSFAVGDVNCDGTLDFFDIDPFVLALFDASGYAAAYPDCDINLADINDDGTVDFFDIDPFVTLLFP